jgi:hypothetical protein
MRTISFTSSALLTTLFGSTLLLNACGAEQTPDTESTATTTQPSEVAPDPVAERGGGHIGNGVSPSAMAKSTTAEQGGGTIEPSTPDPTVGNDPAPEGTDTTDAVHARLAEVAGNKDERARRAAQESLGSIGE